MNAQRIAAAQVRLLYESRTVSVLVTLAAVTILANLEWGADAHSIIYGWGIYVVLVAAGRWLLGWQFELRQPPDSEAQGWGAAYSLAAGLAGAGWGAAGILLYPEADLSHQVYLVFIVGGMMLGASLLLAARKLAFLAFLLPAGVGPTLRLLADGIANRSEPHLAMSLMAGIFTCAVVVTAARVHRMIASSLAMQFENAGLVADLREAKNRADALNEHLETRVEERTAELQLAAEHLRAEMTQRREIEEELFKARKLESLGVMAGGIAHDFNNFLTVVQGNLEIARMQLDAGDPVQAVLSRTAMACQRAAFLSSQLLTFAKGGVPVRRVLAVKEIVNDAAGLARAGSQIAIELYLSDDLRAVEVDSGQMVQALHNILVNAMQSMPGGGIVEIHAVNAIVRDRPAAEARVRISIRDYGCGIPFDVLPRIFDPYFTTKPGASGLGLATAFAIIAKHGGSLSVESKAGAGSTFTVDLPASLAQPAPRPVAPVVSKGAERLLIMDDEEALRQLLETALGKLGYHVAAARDGAEAIALCEEACAKGRAFDAALLDLTVNGGMGGLEAAARLKQVDPKLKLIVSSGYSDAPVMANYRKYGFDGVIRKPWALAEISEVFRKLLVAGPDRR
jgi:signal transduction histidine kinase/CheY-like chemotaxis protein